MQTTAFQPGKILLTCTIVTALFFITLILLDSLNIETKLIAGTRVILLMPFILMMLILPFFLFISIHNTKQPDRKRLSIAIILWMATLLLMIIKTFFIG